MSFLAAPVAKAGIQLGAGLLSSKFAGKKKGGTSSFAPASFSGGGLSSRFNADSGRFAINSSPQRQGLVGNVSATFPEQAGLTRQLRDLVAPGVGALTRSRLEGIGDRSRRAIGNLRENLARRRVLGSSFAQDTLTRAEAEFGREEDRVRSESFLQELDLTNQLIQQEFGLRRNEFQTELDELNLQAELASGLVQGATAQLGANARLKEQLNARSASGIGRFFGQIGQPVASAIGDRLGGGSGIGDFSTVTRNAAGTVI